MTQPACPACGHRAALHGYLLRESWCIAWDASSKRFCGCMVPVVRDLAELAADNAAAEEAYRDMLANPDSVVDGTGIF